MKISDNGLKLVKQFEGCILYAYDDLTEKRVDEGGACKGTLTIGYGHTGKDVKKGMKISQSQADEFLREDMECFEKAVNKYVDKHNLNQNQFDALVSFSFNCGSGALSKVIVSGNITKSMSQYVNSKGIKLKGLVRRRAAEVELYNTPVKPRYFSKYTGNSCSLVDALSKSGVKDTSLSARKKIALANGIKDYKGTASQNTKMLTLLKAGKLKKA